MIKAVFLFLSLCVFQTTMLTYNNVLNKFKIDYPNNWVQKNNVNAILFCSPKEDDKDNFQENVNILLQDLSAHPMNLEEYADITKKQVAENVGSSAMLSIKDVIFSGRKSKEISFNLNLSGKDLKVRQFVFIKENIAYLLTYTAEQSQFEKYKDISTKVMNSFRFY
jgi:serine/threonine-protein kinase